MYIEKTRFTLFYDGACPLCAREIAHLKRLDTQQHIKFEDVNQTHFSTRYPWLPREQALQILHGRTGDGEIVRGLDVTVAAWSLVGRKHWVAWLRWPLIKPLTDFAYRLFAKHRHLVARLLTRDKTCQCNPPSDA